MFASGYAVYGPSSCPHPTGDDALALWDLVRGMQRFPHLYELRHPKTSDDLMHIAEQFRTYVHDSRLEDDREAGALAQHLSPV